MKEIRILRPWEEAKIGKQYGIGKLAYDQFVDAFTRQLRPWDEWTDDERQDIYTMVDDGKLREDIVEKVLDIATRPVPMEEHKLCFRCGGKPEASYYAVNNSAYDDNFIVCTKCDMRTGNWQTEKEAWEDWDDCKYTKNNETVEKNASLSSKQRIEKALEIANNYATEDGDFHKMWVIDQMVRALLEEKYGEWVIQHKKGADGPNTYDWDVGIAP